MAVSVFLLTVHLTCLLVASSLTNREDVYRWRNGRNTRVLSAGGFRQPFLYEPSRKSVQQFTVQSQEEKGESLYLSENGRAKIARSKAVKFTQGGLSKQNRYETVRLWLQNTPRVYFPAALGRSEKPSTPHSLHFGDSAGVTNNQKHGKSLGQKQDYGFLFPASENPAFLEELKIKTKLENEKQKNAAMEKLSQEFGPGSENQKYAAAENQDVESDLEIEEQKLAAAGDFDLERENQKYDAVETLGEEFVEYSEHHNAPSVCGDGLCRCSGVIADCSRNYGRLTYIPRLPLDVKALNFSYNGLTAIASDDFFANVTQIVSLDLHKNSLHTISPGAFRRLTQLRAVFLGFNVHLNFTSLAPVLSVSALTWLDLNDNLLGNVPEDLFQRYPLPGLVNLNLKGNGIKVMNMTSFRPLKHLQYLELAYNQIAMLVTDPQPSLFTKLNLDSNRLYAFPETCSPTGASLFPNLQKLLLGENYISSIPTAVCLPKLQYLSLRFNAFSYFVSNAFSVDRFPSLRELYLDWMVVRVDGVEKSAFNNSGLLVLSLMSNNLPFASSSSVHPDALAGCGSLSTLSLQHNDLQGADIQAMLSNPASLQYLGLQSGGIEVLDCQAFSKLTNLTGLYLSSNNVSSLPDACFDDLPRLQSLTLWGNRIDTLKPSVFSPSTRQRLRSLDLSENPFRCDGGLDWLCQWMKDKPDVFARSRGTYACANVPNATVADNCSRFGGALWRF